MCVADVAREIVDVVEGSSCLIALDGIEGSNGVAPVVLRLDATDKGPPNCCRKPALERLARHSHPSARYMRRRSYGSLRRWRSSKTRQKRIKF